MARLNYYTPGVYVEEVSRGNRAIPGVNLSVAGFIGFTEDIRGDAEMFRPLLITSWNQYLENFAKVGSHGFKKLFDKNNSSRLDIARHLSSDLWAYLPFAVKGWFENGGGRCWVMSIGTELPRPNGTLEDIDEHTTTEITEVRTSAKKPVLLLQLQPDIAEQGHIQVAIEADGPQARPQEDEEPFDSGEFFKVTVKPKDGDEKTLRHLTMKDPDMPTSWDTTANGQYIGEVLAASAERRSQDEPTIHDYITIRLSDTVDDLPAFPLARRPANGLYEVRPSYPIYEVRPWYERMSGSPGGRSGISGLFEVDDVAMVSFPDLMSVYQSGLLSLDQVRGVLEKLITSCESSMTGTAFRMAVIDPPPVKPRQGTGPINPKQQTPQDVETWRRSLDRFSPFATLYYPWFEVANPADSGKPVMVPPSGHMMGLWCRTDETRGIHKAPANEIPRGVINLAYDTNHREQELLNPIGINCIRKFRNRGTLVWGARTLADEGDVENRYVSVRRLMSFIAKSIEEGTQWAVFEPNDPDLWARITRTIKNFLERIWRQGALFGDVPEAAFYVKCDAELNPEETRNLGQLFVEVGVAPVKPAEFVIIRISQWNQSNHSE